MPTPAIRPILCLSRFLPLSLSLSLFLPMSLFLAACTTNMVVNPPDDDVDLAAALPDLSLPSGGEICTKPHTESIGPAGGRLVVSAAESAALSGTTLFIPAGALNGTAPIQITCAPSLAGTDEVALSPSVRLLPDGQSFITAAALTLPYDSRKIPPGSDVILAVSAAGQRDTISGSALNINAATGTVSTELAHFSDYQVLAAKPRTPKPTNDVDVLFVMDNSPSMAPKQRALAQRIPTFIRSLDQLAVDYHIGIISTDVGSQVAAGSPWGGSLGACDTFEGDDGVMQAAACTTRSNGSSEARNACNTLCADPKFVPTDGKPYISKVGGVTNVPKDLILDPMSGMMVDNGPNRAFQCMALLGDGGCGLEAPLESTRRALDGHRAENAGFLRPNSLLAVVILTDEDDCSVQLSRRSENNPATRDCATPDDNASYDCYNIDYRCLARSITCDQPMNSAGTKTNCKERPSNYLEPLTKYASFLQGLRSTNRLLVSGIWSQPGIDKGAKVAIAAGSGGTTTPFLNRAAGANAACVYGGDAAIFGQAQLRLSSFAAKFSDAGQYSICDLDNLDTAIQKITKAIADKAHK